MRDYIIYAGLFFLLIFSPLAFGAVQVWAYTLIEIVALICMVIWLGGRLLEEDGHAKGRGIRPFIFFIIAFVCIAFIQVIPIPLSLIKVVFPGTFRIYSMVFDRLAGFMPLSLYPHASYVEVLKFLAYAAVFWVVLGWASSRSRIKWIVIAVVGVGFFEAVYGILQLLSGFQHIWGYKKIWYTDCLTGTYVNRNHLAGYLEMAIPLAFGLLVYLMNKRERTYKKREINRIRDIFIHFDQSDPYRSRRYLLMFMIVIMAVALLLSGSRGGILAMAVSFILMNLLLLTKHRVRRCAVVSLIISCLILMYGVYIGLEYTVDRFQRMEQDSVGRFNVSRASMDLVREFPVLGTGVGTFEEVFRRVQFTELNAIMDHAHNDWVELWVEMGSVGLVLAICALIWCLLHCVKVWWGRRSGFSLGIGLGGMGAILSLSLHSLTDFNMHIPANALTFGVVVGVTFAALHLKRSHRGERYRKHGEGL